MMVTTFDQALELIIDLLKPPAKPHHAVRPLSEYPRASPTADAIQRHDTPALYRILMDGFSYQGISDSAARSFIDRHGNVDWKIVKDALALPNAICPKLHGFAAYRGCGFRKALHTCGNPEALSSCPVPRLPLRKGILNEQAFSLFFFLRDRCGGDVVGFIDEVLASAAQQSDETAVGREALLACFTEIVGVSRKLVGMMLATIMIEADPTRPRWHAVGRTMIAVDSLVHNFLHRTGTLCAYAAEHRYGPRCFREAGCEGVIRDLSNRYSARAAATNWPTSSPREIQHAIWRFCAADELGVCNGNTINDTSACQLSWCPLWDQCARVPLRRFSKQEGVR